MTPSGWGDSGVLLDAQAKNAYRRRLAEIDEDLEDARLTGDSGRVAQAEAERDFLIRELSRAVGLGGHERRAGSASERARVSVTRAVRHAMSRIRAARPAAGGAPRSGHPDGDLLRLPAGLTDHRILDDLTTSVPASNTGAVIRTSTPLLTAGSTLKASIEAARRDTGRVDNVDGGASAGQRKGCVSRLSALAGRPDQPMTGVGHSRALERTCYRQAAHQIVLGQAATYGWGRGGCVCWCLGTVTVGARSGACVWNPDLASGEMDQGMTISRVMCWLASQ